MEPTAIVAESPAPRLKRAFGAWDLTWLSVVAIANLNVIPVICANGPAVMWLWLAAFAFFFLPQGICVVELSRRFPTEGGIYIWAKQTFGDLHGFLCGWCYWTSNMFYLPTLLIYLLGLVTYIGGSAVGHLAERPIVFASATICLLWLITLANARNIGIGKWVNNIGGLGTLSAALVFIGLGAFCVVRFGVTLPAREFGLSRFDASTFSTFGIVCFALVGLELGCVMGGEIKDPARSVPRGVIGGGVLASLLYLAVSLSLLLALPSSQMRVLQGVVQGVDRMTTQLGVPWLLFPAAMLVAVSIIGAASAWLSGSARILFVSGIDRYLPPMLGKLHGRHRTPHVALYSIAMLSSLLIVMSFAGSSTIKEAYVTLIDLSVVLQMISYLYLFASLMRVAFPSNGTDIPHKFRLRFSAVSGLLTTLLGLGVAFVPSHQVDSVWRFEIKMICSCIVFLGFAAALFIHYSRRRSTMHSLTVEI